jgi:succinoglycan biosynthesis protein ExoA
VKDTLPSVTVLIAARPGQADVKAVDAARRLDYPADKLEIIVARGRQPSAQRNAALRAAHGELVYFLDDDSMPQTGALRRGVSHFAEAQVAMVGGPNLCPPDAPWLERVFAVALGSWLAFGPSRARYAAVGNLRATSEKELILCNLLARRNPILELGGFNEALYPNEENALMDECQKRGGQLLYDPHFAVFRRPRRTLGAFVRMLMTYGRGRAEQFRLHPTPGSALNFVPPMFCVYLLALAAIQIFLGGTALARWSLAPLAVYLLAVMIQTIASMPAAGIARSLLAMPLVMASHVFYGLGFWRGMFTRLRPETPRGAGPIALETVTR